MASIRALIVPLALLGCDTTGRRPRLHVAPPDEPPTLSTTATAREPMPAGPVIAAALVSNGQYWRLMTPRGPVHVWIPNGHKARRAETVVYVHGYYTHVDDAWADQHLAEQFATSGIDAAFIACEAPAGFDEVVSWPSLAPLLDAVEHGIGQPLPRRRVVTIGHSAAFRTILGWLDEPLLDTLVLMDAAYGEIEAYRSWVLASPKHRLIDVGDDTRKWTDQLHAELPDSVVLDAFPTIDEGIPATAAHARVLYIRSNLGHFPLITGGVALPMILQTLRARHVLDVPLAQISESP